MLRKELPGFVVHTVTDAGWNGIQNGALLRLAASEYDVFLTGDRNLPHQQNLGGLSLGVVVLSVGSTKIQDLSRYAPAISEAIASVQPGQLLYIRKA
jgi:hypothetical protein